MPNSLATTVSFKQKSDGVAYDGTHNVTVTLIMDNPWMSISGAMLTIIGFGMSGDGEETAHSNLLFKFVFIFINIVVDSLVVIFDAFYHVRLNDTSVKDRVLVNSTEECARICLDNDQFGCFSFDVIGQGPQLTCAMAGQSYEVIPVPNGASQTDSRNSHERVVHFELDPDIGK